MPTPPSAPRAIVLDLDQTLLRAEALDWQLWLLTVGEALGTPVPRDEDWAAHPVHTDHGLLDSLSWKLRGRPFGDDERVPFEARLMARLDAALDQDPAVFETIPGADAFVAAVADRAALATGNLHAATERKLRSSGLHRHRLPCSCSARGIDRVELVRRALTLRGWRPGAPATSLGDGVWDVRAARALSIGFVGVAQSDAHELRLRAAGALHVLRDYLDLDAALRLVEQADPPAPERTVETWQAP